MKLKPLRQSFPHIALVIASGSQMGSMLWLLVLNGWKEMGLVNEGDEVIAPAHTFVASILAISQAGLKPVLVEPDPQTFNICPKNISAAVSKKTKVIMVVHLYGQLAPMPEIMNIATDNNLLVLEDAAQAHGAEMNGKKPVHGGTHLALAFTPEKIWEPLVTAEP